MKEPPRLSGTPPMDGNCKHLSKHSEVQEVHCTVVHLDVVCDCCGQVVNNIIEV